MPDVEIRIARFLGLPLADVKNPDFSLTPTKYENAHLRRVRFIDEDRLAPAIHSALKIGAAVVRNLQNPESFQDAIPNAALAWRHQILKSQTNVTLDKLLEDLWGRGIPVVPIEVLPAPNFQGMACIIEDRPIILLGQRHDAPGHVAFIIRTRLVILLPEIVLLDNRSLMRPAMLTMMPTWSGTPITLPSWCS